MKPADLYKTALIAGTIDQLLVVLETRQLSLLKKSWVVRAAGVKDAIDILEAARKRLAPDAPERVKEEKKKNDTRGTTKSRAK